MTHPAALVLLVELVLAGVLAAWIVALAVGRQRRLARETKVRARVRERLGTALARPGEAQPARDLAATLPAHSRVELLSQLRRSLTGPDRDRAVELFPVADLVSGALADCDSRSWRRRVRGLRWLGALGSEERRSATHVHDPHPRVRCEAAWFVGTAGDAADADALTDLLEDPWPGCRFAAADILTRLTEVAPPAVARYLARPTATQQAPALEVAAALASPGLLEPALALKGHDAAAVRRGVARVCTSVGGESGTTHLQTLLADPAPEVRAAAATGLGRVRHWPAAPSLAELLTDESDRARRAAALALWEIGAPGHIYLRRAARGDHTQAADIAQQVLGTPRDRTRAVDDG